MVAKDLGPLDYRTPIVAKDGTPSPEFQRRWNTQRHNNGLIGFVAVGDGPPTDTPQGDGQVYVDITATPWTLYVADNGAWEHVGVYAFTELSDVPHAYTGAAGELVRVAGTEDALQFATISAVLDGLGAAEGDVLYRGASGWTVLVPATAGELLSTGGAGAPPAWAAISAVLDSLGSTRGDVLYRGASGWTALAPGTAGNVLSTGGAGADPSWVPQSAGATGANPSATASDTAVNGSASTFMRSDAAPAVEKASATQFGIVKVDGSTITETGGVISATGGGGGGVSSVDGVDGITASPSPIVATGTVGLSPIADATMLANASGATSVPVPTTISDLLDETFGSTGGPTSYRYWRLTMALSDGGGGVFAGSNMQMKSSGTNLATNTSNITARGTFGGFDVRGLINGSFGQWADVNGTSWVQYDFGSPVLIDEVTWTSRTDNSANQSPKSFSIQGSNDASTWVNVGYCFHTGWTLSDQQTFTIPAYTFGDSYDYWGVGCNSNSAGGAYAMAEIQNRATIGGSSQNTGGTAGAGSSFSGTTPGDAYDGSLSTFWASADLAVPAFIWYLFAAPVGTVELAIFARNDSNFGQAPLSMDVIFGTDGQCWGIADRITAATWTGAGQEQDFVLSAPTAAVAQGAILFRGASAWEVLAAGTAGQVLTSGGAGADPSWA